MLGREQAVKKRGYPIPADIYYLDSIFSVNDGIGINQQALKYILAASFTSDFIPKHQYLDSAIYLLEDQYNQSEKTALLFARAVNIKGMSYFRIKRYEDAMRNLSRYKLALSYVKDSCSYIFYYNNMADILFAQKKFLDAVPFYKTTASLYMKCRPRGAFTMAQASINNVGICFSRAGVLDSSDYYHKAALDFINTQVGSYDTSAALLTKIPIMKSVIYSNQGDLYVLQKKNEEAERIYKESIAVSNGALKAFEAGTRISLLTFYNQTQQYAKAKDVITTLSQTMDTTAIETNVMHFYDERSKYRRHTNNSRAAYDDISRSHFIKDSLERRNKEFYATNVAQEFENMEQKAINIALQKDNKIKKSYLLLLIISTTLACVIMALVLYNFKRKSQYLKRLQNLNKAINLKNEELQEAIFSLEQSHAENKKLMLVVAHDLRNPIGAVRVLTYSLLKNEMRPQQRESLALIRDTCSDSLALIKDLLANKKKLAEIHRELVDMGQLVEKCGQLLQLNAEEKKQHLKLQLDNPVVFINPDQMQRVVSNIITNAIKFSPEKSEIRIKLEVKDTIVVLSVRDHGIGIPPSLKDKIFAETSEASRIGTSGEESYGLGLSISQKIVEAHKGKLWFDSEEGKGSTFFIELPYAQ